MADAAASKSAALDAAPAGPAKQRPPVELEEQVFMADGTPTRPISRSTSAAPAVPTSRVGAQAAGSVVVHAQHDCPYASAIGVAAA